MLYSDPASTYAGLGGMDWKVADLLDVDGLAKMVALCSAVFGKEWRGEGSDCPFTARLLS